MAPGWISQNFVDVTHFHSFSCFNITVTSNWALWHLKSPATQMFIQPFKLTSNKTSKATVLVLCEGNPLVTGGFRTQRASDAESVSMSWRHHEMFVCILMLIMLKFLHRVSFTSLKFVLSQTIAWCHKATSYHMNQCWARSTIPY